MSGYVDHSEFFTREQEVSYNFELPPHQCSQQELSFQSIESGSPSYISPPSIGDYDTGAGVCEDDPPLLEELGINPEYIVQKTLTVLNPLHTPDAAALQDIDLAGPLVFCLALGGVLLLSGKVHFSYIYGIGVLGCLSMWALLSLMAAQAVTIGTVVTVLGYCLLPMVGLSGVNAIISLQGNLGAVLSGLAILWCSLSASKLFVTALNMDHQQSLVVYPCALLYAVFALITVF